MMARIRSLMLSRRASEKPVKGTMGRVIVVREPAPCFREALFVLRDDWLMDPQRDREELLREAREAAAAFSGAGSPPPPRRRLLWLLPVLMLAALVCLRLCGLL